MKPFDAQTSSAPFNNKDLFVTFYVLMTPKVSSPTTHFRISKVITALSLIAAQTALGQSEALPTKAHLQVFGDVFIDGRALATVAPPEGPTALFSGVSDLLATSQFNLVNFEGSATKALRGLPSKEFHLRMPVTTPRTLADAGIEGVTLANNHSMDFGWMGLFETLSGLRRAGLSSAGAGENYAAAAHPLYFANEQVRVCILSFARTFPESAWATTSRAGTANPSPQHLRKSIQDCVAAHASPIVIFHWGRELESVPQPYQRELGHLAIEAGAVAVIGHHPHVLQEIEVYMGKPIIYSIGNFVFSSLPLHSSPEGIAVRMTWISPTQIAYELVPLTVNNRKVNYRPRPLLEGETDPLLAKILPAHGKSCSWVPTRKLWACLF